jgi:hypothetical protein
MARVNCTKKAMTTDPQNQRRLWIDPDGNLFAVPENESHEEWAIKRDSSLEALFAAGWLRVSAIIPPFCYLDFRLSLTTRQADAVKGLLTSQFHKIVVERQGDPRTFTDAEDALKFCLGG